jgi:hypothetical protein
MVENNRYSDRWRLQDGSNEEKDKGECHGGKLAMYSLRCSHHRLAAAFTKNIY